MTWTDFNLPLGISDFEFSHSLGQKQTSKDFLLQTMRCGSSLHRTGGIQPSRYLPRQSWMIHWWCGNHGIQANTEFCPTADLAYSFPPAPRGIPLYSDWFSSFFPSRVGKKRQWSLPTEFVWKLKNDYLRSFSGWADFQLRSVVWGCSDHVLVS